MSIESRYYVYHDEDYALSWISDNISKRISEYFTKKEFNKINTNDLIKVMKEWDCQLKATHDNIHFSETFSL